MKSLINKTRALLLVTLSGSAFAAENVTSKIIGLSKDGKTLVFQNDTVQDGSGFAETEILFIDTTKNQYAAPPVIEVEGDGNDTTDLKRVRARALAKAAPILKKLGVTPGSAIDPAKLRLVFASSNYLTSQAVTELKFVNRGAFWERTSPGAGSYKLSLESTLVRDEDELGFGESALLTVKLEGTLNRDGSDLETQILQKDVRLPASRKFAFAYEISQVLLLDPTSTNEEAEVSTTEARVIVVLDVFRHGFEGANTEKMVVTGYLSKR